MVNRQQRLNRHEKDNVDLSDDFITDVVENFTAADKGIFAKAGITVQDGQRPPSDIVDTNRCKPKGRNQKETEESKGRRANPENNWHGLLFVLTKGGRLLLKVFTCRCLSECFSFSDDQTTQGLFLLLQTTQPVASCRSALFFSGPPQSLSVLGNNEQESLKILGNAVNRDFHRCFVCVVPRVTMWRWSQESRSCDPT